jgi:glycosyltransferase involved in cell wall biosynthesis
LNDKVRTRRMKLAIVLPSLRRGLTYWPPIIKALDAEGITVRVFTGMPPPETPSIDLEVVKGRILRDRVSVRGYEKSFSYTSPRLISSLARWKPDVIIAMEYRISTLWSLVAGLVARCPVAIFQEHRSPEEFLRSPTRHLFRLLVLARFADAFVANTNEAAAEIITRLRVPPRKVFEVPTMLSPPRDYLLTEHIELPDVAFRPVFVFVGQLIGRKNVHSLLKAAQGLLNEGRKLTVWIAGDGPDRAMLERLVRSTGLSDIVKFLGAVSYRSIGHLYEAADIFVMPSLSDYRSVTVLEATRFGMPIIDSVFDGNAGDTVISGQNGFTFDPTSPNQLTDCMRAFIDDPKLIRRMANRSAERFAGLSHESSARQLAQVLRSRLLGWDDESTPSKEAS